MKSYYITTAIDYANGSPHLGHAYEKVITDVIARYHRQLGENVYFLTGLDEHGQKVQQTAEKLNLEPQVLCDQIADEFQNLWKKLSISNDDYLRTTQERHKKVVAEILQNLFEKDEIYLADYKGYYSVRVEQFVQTREMVDGKWPSEYGEVVEVIEKNYFFKLSKYQAWLIDYIKNNDEFIFPKFRQKQVLEFLKEPINDLCISRPKKRLSWGIPLPFDTNYVTYVWFDALINYITGAGYESDNFKDLWPADCHVIGKDILVPPHAVYWPIMLKACDIPLPISLLAHGWWLTSGEKMSKSTGEIVDPIQLIDQYGPDAFRYFVTREMNIGQDSEFSLQLFMSRYNSDLANDLGNLVSRFLNMSKRYCESIVPKAEIEEEPEADIKNLWSKTKSEYCELCDGFQFHQALDRTFTFIREINRYIEIRSPWKLAKSEENTDRKILETTLATIGESLRLSAALLYPIMPNISTQIYQLVGIEKIGLMNEELAWSNCLEGNSVAEKAILFPKK